MNKYQEVVYGNYLKTNYPDILANYLFDNYFDYSYKSRRDWSFLDLGCGDGTYLRSFNKIIDDVQGIDSDIIFKRHKIKGGVSLLYPEGLIEEPIKIDFEKDKLPFEDNSFRFIFTKSVIEHIRNTDFFLSEIYRVLKPGGTVYILTPAWEHNYRDFFNDYTHVKPFHRKGLQDALKINYFKEVKVDYFYHLPVLWKHPGLMPLIRILALLHPFKWIDKEQTRHRVLIRFAQEVQLLGIGRK